MNKFSVLALVALSAMAGIASSQNPALNTCVALAGGMGSTKSTITGTSSTVCYYSDAACATSNDALCGQMRTMAGEGASACKDGCLSASAGTNTNTNTNTDVTNSPVATVDVQAAGHSEKEGGGDMFASLSAAEQKELGVGGKGDKCNGFKLFLRSEAANKKCEAFDTKTTCEAGGCKYEGSKCDPTAATMMEVMGVEMDQEKMQAEMAAKVKGAKTLEDRMKIQKDMLKKYAKSMVPVMNDMNATMVEIAKFMKRCGGGKTKAACAADKVCELQLAFNASTDNFTQQCNVNKAKAVEETGCSGVARAVADLDALERKAVAAGAKKALAGKQEKQTAAKKAVTDYKEANPTATADTDNALKALETQAASADAEVIAASATVTTADAEATAAEQKAAATPEDSSTLRALPSIMAVVAATVAAAFA